MRGAMITRMDGLRGSAWRVHVPLAFGLGIVAVLAFLVFRPFLLTFVVAGSVALLLAPLQRRSRFPFRFRARAATGRLGMSRQRCHLTRG